MNNFLSDTDIFNSFMLPMLWDTNQDQDQTELVRVQPPNKKIVSATKVSDKLNEQ